MTTKQETKAHGRCACAPVGKLGRAFAEVSPVSLSTRYCGGLVTHITRACALPSTILAARRRLQYTLWLGEASE